MPFDGTKCRTETPSSYLLDSLSRKLAEQARTLTPPVKNVLCSIVRTARLMCTQDKVRFPRNLILGSSLNKRAAPIRPGTV